MDEKNEQYHVLAASALLGEMVERAVSDMDVDPASVQPGAFRGLVERRMGVTLPFDWVPEFDRLLELVETADMTIHLTWPNNNDDEVDL